MDAKEYLSQAYYLHLQIVAKERRLAVLKEVVPCPSAVLSGDSKPSKNPRDSVVESAVVRMVTLEEEIASDIERLVDVMKDIERRIKGLDSIECRTILEMRYLSFMGWDEIATRLGYGSNYVFRLHRKALRMLGG